MDRARFIEIAPYYYALAIASFFREFMTEATATKIAIRARFWDDNSQESDPDNVENHLGNDVLFDAGIAILVAKEMVSIIGDDFGPDIYERTDAFDAGWQSFASDKELPFYKFSVGRRPWLENALSSVNIRYAQLEIKREDFEQPNKEWEPLPLDRRDTKLQAVTEQLEDTIEQVRADNGYAATSPGERDVVVESLSDVASKLKKDTSTTWGYLQRNAFEPLKLVLRRFKGGAVAVTAVATRAAFEAWIKGLELGWLNQLWHWFWSKP